ncbi:LytR/AlgR family response regulator transcription factor [Parablautia muri]|uniref:Stage 0 sporulation protein A homolog n=1 Tax=Parablautia muri TaxID=2320879 RepID=A0A9X5BFT8_9FIRM|nr:LytTR family DNA-binding domain-containing protein [Parablautia muri]NBJ93006.1 DNA-binding response regulator [Parablautia muri]
MYRIGICDDDKALCSGLEEQIYQIAKELSVKVDAEVWYSGESMLHDLQNDIQVDLIFLDIELVQADGISIGKFIRNRMEDINTHIVYISSKQTYAMQLFKVQPLDFLVKPVSGEQIKEVLIRSIRLKQSLRNCFEYQKGSVIFRIPTKDIVYFTSMDKKIKLVARNSEDEFYGKLKSIIEELPADFMMIHQSYIVNQLYVGEYAYDYVRMSDGTVLSISKPYRKQIRDKVKQYRRTEIYGQ